MSKAVYGVYGSSGYGREVMPMARAQLKVKGIDPAELMFIDDGASSSEVNGHAIVSYADFIQIDATSRHVVVAIANSVVREKLVDRCRAGGIEPWTVTAANAIVMDSVSIGAGAILGLFVTLTSNIKIGVQFHANIYSYVAHDCVIGDFVTFAPSVMCNGNIIIEDHAYIGTGAVIKQGTPDKPLVIGRGATVGMGAVVTRSVPAGAVVVGNPAKPLITN